jgi:RNA polymerase sigma-70 factor (ECF subfamily)
MRTELLLAAARSGDEDAFRKLVEPYRAPLHRHCRRMLGSAHDAEDAMQDVMLRAWRSLPTFQSRSPLRAWLYRIATNACLSMLEKRPSGVVPIDYCDSPADPHDDAENDQGADAAAAVEVTLVRLPPSQRAALLLREVLGFSAREIASVLGTTPASVNSALQRARANLDLERHGDGSPEVQDAVDGFVGALKRDDVDALIGIAAGPVLAPGRSWAYSPVPAY